MKILQVLLISLVLLPAAARAQFIFTTNNGAITIMGYAGAGGAVTIPGSTNGLPVTRIGNGAFQNKIAMTSVVIPSSVTNIGSDAFQGCNGLTSVALSEQIKAIGLFAFGNCRKLTAITVDPLNPFYGGMNGILFSKDHTTLIQFPAGLSGPYTIPEGVTRIQSQAFVGSTKLVSVLIPGSVTNIGSDAFEYCISLSAITVDANNPVYGSVEGVLFDKSQASLVAYPAGKGGDYIVPGGVTRIGPYAFAYASLTNITIADSVTSIEDGAFIFCPSLAGVIIGSGITNISGNAFFDCSSLSGVYFRGNAPSADNTAFSYDATTVYYLPGTVGWEATFADVPTAPWLLPNPIILNQGLGFGALTNGFSFTISWATNAGVVVEACTDLASPVWQPLQTNTLVDGSFYFTDAAWADYPDRFYRLRSP